MDTGLILPNGIVIYPRKYIPPYSIIIKKFQFGHRFENVITNTEAIFKNIITAFVGENTDDIGPAPLKIPTNTDIITGDRQTSVFFNMGFIRLLQFLVINYLF